MLKVRDVLWSAMTRVVPGAVGLFAAVLVFDLARGVRFNALQLQLFSAAIVGIVVGYAVAMILLRSRLRADAQVSGRRSAIVGVVAAAAWYGAAMLIGNPWHSWLLLVLSLIGTGVAAGAGGTLAVFFPWLTAASSPEPRDRVLE